MDMDIIIVIMEIEIKENIIFIRDMFKFHILTMKIE